MLIETGDEFLLLRRDRPARGFLLHHRQQEVIGPPLQAGHQIVPADGL